MIRLLSILLVIIFFSPFGYSQDIKENDHLFYLEKTAKGISYSDGNAKVATKDLLNYWGKMVIQEGRDTKVAILFHENVPLSAVVNFARYYTKGWFEQYSILLLR